MRFLYATYYYLPHVGGGTWYAYHVARYLMRKGHQVLIAAPRLSAKLSLNDASDYEVRGAPVLRLSRFTMPVWIAPIAGLLLLRPRMLRLAKTMDLIVGQFHPHHTFALAAILLGRITGRPVALRVEDWRRWMYGRNPNARMRLGFLLEGPVNALNEWAAERSDLLLVVNEDEAAHFRQRPVRTPRLVVSPNGFDAEAVARLPDRQALRQRFGIADDVPIIVAVGRFSGVEYGVDVLLQALRLVRGEEPKCKLYLVGDTLPPTMLKDHGDLQRSGGLVFTGPVSQSDALAYTAMADLAVGPMGPTRTTPLKIIEALAVGTPIVTGELSFGPELSVFAPFAKAVPANPVALASALLDMIESPPRFESLRSGSLIDQFEWDRIADGAEREFLELTRSHGPW